MAMSRALARLAAHQVRDQIDALFLRLGNGVLHGRFVHSAVLDQPLGRPPRAMRLVPPTAAKALSFMDLRGTPLTGKPSLLPDSRSSNVK